MNLKQSLLVSAISLLFFTQCSKNSDDPVATDSFDYAVYSGILDQGFDRLKEPVISKETTKIETNFSFRDGVYESYIAEQGVAESLFEALVAKNESSIILDDKFSIAPRTVQLITQEELNLAFTPEGSGEGEGTWEDFYTKYPESGGYISFSRIGYNNSGSEALVEFAHIYGGLGADGGFAFVKKEGDSWIVKKWIYVWVS